MKTWVGTADGHVQRVDDEATSAEKRAGNAITGLTIDEGHIVSVSEDGVVARQGKVVTHDADAVYVGLARGTLDGAPVWVAARLDGIAVLDYATLEEIDVLAVSDATVISLSVAGDKALYGTEAGLVRLVVLAGGSFEVLTALDAAVTHVALSRGQLVFALDAQGALWRYDDVDAAPVRLLPSVRFAAMASEGEAVTLVDRAGVLWRVTMADSVAHELGATRLANATHLATRGDMFAVADEKGALVRCFMDQNGKLRALERVELGVAVTSLVVG